MVTVHGANISPFVRKVRVLLAEKNIAYTLQPVNPFTAGPEYRKLSPLGRIPAFQDDQTTLADSSVICAYVERTNPQPALYPAEAVA
ncbi:MAG: glutathione S-transferase family protein, partial [Deltaproteobacteria bacterium]|nr:glutathione S-transferase family protein [Deltaproteobacteria bacterium]